MPPFLSPGVRAETGQQTSDPWPVGTFGSGNLTKHRPQQRALNPWHFSSSVWWAQPQWPGAEGATPGALDDFLVPGRPCFISFDLVWRDCPVFTGNIFPYSICNHLIYIVMVWLLQLECKFHESRDLICFTPIVSQASKTYLVFSKHSTNICWKKQWRNLNLNF